MTGRKERKKKIQLRLWDSNPQPLAFMDKGPARAMFAAVCTGHRRRCWDQCLLQSVQDIGGGVGISVCSSDKYRPTEMTSGRVTTENSLSKFLMGNQFNEVVQINSCLVHSM